MNIKRIIISTLNTKKIYKSVFLIKSGLSIFIFLIIYCFQILPLQSQVISDYFSINQLLNYNCINPQNFYFYQLPIGQKTPDGTKFAGKKTSRTQEDSTYKSLSDTTDRRDKIVSLRQVGDVHILKIELRDYKTEISITAYNLLGKKVLDIYKGLPKNPEYPYEVPSWKLPNGIYICTLLGKDFRKSEKFIVAR